MHRHQLSEKPGLLRKRKQGEKQNEKALDH